MKTKFCSKSNIYVDTLNAICVGDMAQRLNNKVYSQSECRRRRKHAKCRKKQPNVMIAMRNSE